MTGDIEKARHWLLALQEAERIWMSTDYRTPEYNQAINSVLSLVRDDYIINALKSLRSGELVFGDAES